MVNAKIVIAAMLAIANVATAKPVAPARADEFRQELRRAVDSGTSNIVSPQKRRAHAAELDALVKRADQLFDGPFDPIFGPCVKAARLLQSTWLDQMEAAGRAEMGGSLRPDDGRGATFLANRSFEAGIEYWACRTAIDALLPQMPKECLVVIDVTKPNAPMPPRPSHCPKL